MANTAAPTTDTTAPAVPPLDAHGKEDQQRLSNTTACLPIIYGSIAHYLGKKADEFQTHEWSLYVRGPNHEDLSSVITSVVFTLHPSFAKPVRELTHPPFEVTERGWGEFEAQIRINWKDPTEKASVVNHGIRLYPPGTGPNALGAAGNNREKKNKDGDDEGEKVEPVIAENYDEIVFTDPKETFYRQLMRVSAVPKIVSSQQEFFNKKIYQDEEDFLALIGAQKFLKEQLASVKKRFSVVTDELMVVEQDLMEAQALQKKTQPPPRPGTAGKKKGGGAKRSQSKKAKTS